MKLDKQLLKKLILESIQEQQFDGGKRVSPIGQNPAAADTNKSDPKQVLKQNISQQIRILKFVRETLKQIKLPAEMQNIISQVKKSKTPDFLKQVLGVDEAIPIKVSSFLESPLELFSAIIDEIIRVSMEKGNKKLTEGIITEKDISFYLREPEARLAKHKKKHHEIPAPKLEEKSMNLITEEYDNLMPLKPIFKLMRAAGVRSVTRQKDPIGLWRIGEFRAQGGAEVFAMEAQKLMPEFNIRAEQKKTEGGYPYWIAKITQK